MVDSVWKTGLSRSCLKLKGKQGSGPEEVDDLCFHTYGGFSPSPPSPPPPPSLPPLKSQSRGPNSNLEAQIPVLRPKSQPQGPNPSLKAQILAWRLRFGPQGRDLGLLAEILTLRLKFGPQD